jgi:excisionase family DNA binding protein
MNIKIVKNKKAYGTHKIATICHVTPPTIWQWIKEGKLPSFTTGGGHHRVWESDLLAFLKAHNIPIPSQLQNADTLKILIVDDEAPIRKLISRIVKQTWPAAIIIEAKNGFEAGRKITIETPDLAIIDIFLPGINGVEVCSMIKQDQNLKKIKVLAISGKATADIKARIMNAGADEFLAKPFGAAQLVDTLNRLIKFSLQELTTHE